MRPAFFLPRGNGGASASEFTIETQRHRGLGKLLIGGGLASGSRFFASLRMTIKVKDSKIEQPR
jgi:hypothetical protein